MTVEERLSALERSVYRWKLSAGVALVLAVIAGLGSCASPSQPPGAPDPGRAQRIVQVGLEALGIKVMSGTLEAREVKAAETISAKTAYANAFTLIEPTTSVPVGGLQVTGSGGTLLLRPAGKPDADAAELAIYFRANGPAVALSDKNGLRSVLGVADLMNERTGATEMTSAGSITFFDKKGNVVWRYPFR